MRNKRDLEYWTVCYRIGIGAGPGSAGALLKFKINYLNTIFGKYNINSIFDFGCGNGVVSAKLNCQSYFGVDICPLAIENFRLSIKKQNFQAEIGQFEDYSKEIIISKLKTKPDCCICLDVLYHISDFECLKKTLQNIFNCGAKFIVLYTIPWDFPRKEIAFPNVQMYYRDILKILSDYSNDYKLVRKSHKCITSQAIFLTYIHRDLNE